MDFLALLEAGSKAGELPGPLGLARQVRGWRGVEQALREERRPSASAPPRRPTAAPPPPPPATVGRRAPLLLLTSACLLPPLDPQGSGADGGGAGKDPLSVEQVRL